MIQRGYGGMKARLGAPDESAAMRDALAVAISAVRAAWNVANKTPAYHGYTDDLAKVLVEIEHMRRMA